jgi:hypothetical protein
MRILRVEVHKFGEENVGDRSEAHGGTRMARIRLVNSIYLKKYIVSPIQGIREPHEANVVGKLGGESSQPKHGWC